MFQSASRRPDPQDLQPHPQARQSDITETKPMKPGHDDFRPLPLLANPHVQTLLGVWWRGAAFSGPSVARQVLLPDGDWLVVHDSVPACWRAGGPVAVLVHGLTGSHESGYMQRVACRLIHAGVRAVRVNLRGCGSGEALARRPYHAGCSEDVRVAVAEIRRWCPGSPVALAGFSLGGNIVLKLAGEAARRAVPGLEQVVAVAPPVDLEGCARLLALRRNRLYDFHFARELVAAARRKRRYFPDLPPVRFPRRMTLRRFDDLYTAPRCGFADALDYYRRSSSLPLIPRIQVPTLILSARDDPFISSEPLERFSAAAHVAVRIVGRGGHLGFLGWDGTGGVRWAERQVVDWILRGPTMRPTARAQAGERPPGSDPAAR